MFSLDRGCVDYDIKTNTWWMVLLTFGQKDGNYNQHRAQLFSISPIFDPEYNIFVIDAPSNLQGVFNWPSQSPFPIGPFSPHTQKEEPLQPSRAAEP